MHTKLIIVIAIGLSCNFAFTFDWKSQSDYKTLNGRYRRETTGSECQDLVAKKKYCLKSVTWNLTAMFMNVNCSSSISDKTQIDGCIQKEVCQPTCVISNIDEITCEKNQDTWRKFVLLKLLCSQIEAGQPCLSVIYDAYLSAATDNKKLEHLNTTSGRCCIASLMNIYNSTGNVTELLPESWENAGFPIPTECHLQELKSSTAVQSSTKLPAKVTSQSTSVAPKITTKLIKLSSTVLQTSKNPTPGKDPGGKESSSIMSSRLKASLVIASIIFIVVAVILGRFFYHRMQRQRRAKYEDYGYSQLKVILEDNLYEDDEDDDPLLSAT